MITRVMLAVSGVLLIFVAWFVFSTMRPVADPPEMQIKTALNDAVGAYNTGRVWDAMRIVSAQYKDSAGLTRDQLAALITRYRVEAPNALVTIDKAQVQVTNGEAVVPMDLSFSGSGARRYSVTLHLREEDVRVYGVIPVKRWRVQTVDNMPDMRDML